ncbi:hypothetical protein CAOG_009401 [Capsaspora owczarzaki ATCC 30864]|uniref:Uncharacterized protein n=1 Tax=Capsaspora owczarzaki (strain ATCC 30864) TaxID=595528 RepID=A0A0D2WIV9_CAPO3|nr:hypothetical protein CAOG_009401 [Capsaspora owczarzaki ATCC 30864]
MGIVVGKDSAPTHKTGSGRDRRVHGLGLANKNKSNERNSDSHARRGFEFAATPLSLQSTESHHMAISGWLHPKAIKGVNDTEKPPPTRNGEKKKERRKKEASEKAKKSSRLLSPDLATRQKRHHKACAQKRADETEPRHTREKETPMRRASS